MTGETFELFMLGGAIEKRYRRMRPEIARLPWGTLDPSAHAPDLVIEARKSWTLAAFQEHRTGAACAESVQAMIVARVPVDLVAVATRFPLDEMVHVEMCARLAEELGGGTHVEFDPRTLIPSPSPHQNAYAGRNSRVRLRTDEAPPVTTTSSSMRTPPILASSATSFQSIAPPCLPAFTSSMRAPMK